MIDELVVDLQGLDEAVGADGGEFQEVEAAVGGFDHEGAVEVGDDERENCFAGFEEEGEDTVEERRRLSAFPPQY